MAKKKTNKNIPLPILILIYAVLLHAIYTSISTLALAVFGQTQRQSHNTGDSQGHAYVSRRQDVYYFLPTSSAISA